MVQIDKLLAASPAYWADKKAIKIQAGPFSFQGHEYQLGPMQSTKRTSCCIKGTQGGWTEMEVLKALHGLIYGRYLKGVLYMFPTSTVVSDFSSSRFDPLINDNYDSIGQYVCNTDRIGLKRVGAGYLYLRGAKLSQKVQGTEKQSAQLSSIPVDRCVFDEVDQFDEKAIAKALARMGHSTIKEESYLSNPTIPGYGIDRLYRASDMSINLIRCDGCKTETCVEIEFPNCVKLNSDGTGYIACKKCGKKIIPRNNWQARYPERAMAGFWWSQLQSAFIDPATILEAYNNPPQGNIADVHRLMLGKAYISLEDQLTIDSVLSCCGNDGMVNVHRGPCGMGIDVGNWLHVGIGCLLDYKRTQLLKIFRVPNNESGWNFIHDCACHFNVKSCVIDIGPDIFKPRDFQAKEPYEIFLCRYSETLQTGTKWDVKTGVVTANRTELCDQTHWQVMTPGVLLLPRMCSEIDLFSKQMCALAKYPEKDEFTGAITERYKCVDTVLGDHYRHVMNYLWLALQRGVPIISEYNQGNKQLETIDDYQMA